MKSVVLCSLLIASCLLSNVEASHFRYGTGSFVETSNPLSGTFTLNLAMRRSFFGSPNVGNSLGSVGDFYCDGYYYGTNFITTNIDASNDIVYASWSFGHTFGNAGSYYCYFESSARISNLNNNANGAFQFGVTANIKSGQNAPNNSPVSGLLPVVNVPYNRVPYSFQITASDPENDALTFRNAQSSESQGNQPPGLTVSASGLVTINSVLAQGYWSTQQVITDSWGNNAAVDYLLFVTPTIKYCNAPCGASMGVCGSDAACASCGSCVSSDPAVVTSASMSNMAAPANGATITVPAGTATTVNFVAYDDALPYATTIREYFSGVPSFVTTSSQTNCDAAHGCTFTGNYPTPQLISFTANPPNSAIGTSSTVCLGVTSNGNALSYSQHCVTLSVISGAVCGNGIVETGESCDGGACCDNTCNFRASAYTCRASVDANCDVAEMCTGNSATCPADTFAPATVTCRAAADPICDVAEMCTGNSPYCPADSFSAPTTVCRAATGPCDVTETCTGSSAFCPADSIAGTNVVCRAVNGTCDAAEYCDGNVKTCPIDDIIHSTQCEKAKYVCPRVHNPTLSYTEYFCDPTNPGHFMMCYSQIANGVTYNTFTDMVCGAGTGCGCPYGVDCGCSGQVSPCTSPTSPTPHCPSK